MNSRRHRESLVTARRRMQIDWSPPKKIYTPISFPMGPSHNFPFCRLSENLKSLMTSWIRWCGAAAIAPEESDPLLKLAKAKEMLAADDLEDAATMCADAAEEVVDCLAKDLRFNIPEDMSTE